MFLPKLNGNSVANTTSLLDAILKKLPGDPLLREFAEQFLQGASARMLEVLGTAALQSLVQGRFAFFQEAVAQGGALRVQPKVDDPDDPDSTGSGRLLIDVVSRDTPFQVVTLECLLRKLDLHILRRLHPMMMVEYNAEGKPTKVSAPQLGSGLYSVIHLEIEGSENPEFLSMLEAQLAQHLRAVQQSAEDQPEIRKRLQTLAETISQVELLSKEERQEWAELIPWLLGNFACFGAGLLIPNPEGGAGLQLEDESGLGILRASDLVDEFGQRLKETLLAHSWRFQNFPEPFRLDRLPAISPVLRFEPLMRLSIKLPHPEHGQVEHVFLALLRRSSLNARNLDTPIVRRKLRRLFETLKLLPDTYSYNEAVRIFAATPKFELFRASESELGQVVENLVSLNNPRRIHCFQIRSEGQEHLRLLVLTPSELLDERASQKVAEHLQTLVPHRSSEWFYASGEEVSRVHVDFVLSDPNWQPPLQQLETEIGRRLLPWEEQVRGLLRHRHPGADAKALFERYVPMMPPHYRVRNTVEAAVRDMENLEQLAHEGGIAFDLVVFSDPTASVVQASLLYVYSRSKLDLIKVMPVLLNLGIHVIDQLTARIGNGETTLGYIQSFRITRKSGETLNEAQTKPLLVPLLRAIFQGQTENDPLNALALKSGLDWKAINVLQLYRNLYLQLGPSFSRETVNCVLLDHADCARLLYEQFVTSFDPDEAYGSVEHRHTVLLPRLEQGFHEALQEVDGITDDLVLRRLHSLVQQSLRTNFYIPRPADETVISVKLNSRKSEQMPVPAPFREIYVHDVGMEGTHLRFGPVARGGLRWSDRPDDFRTEVLGLVKTQQTKNVVIVPVGSKGGFYVKNPGSTRESAATEAQRQYKKFIGALLDVTDTLDEQGQVCCPNRVLAYDEVDPYLVVAADKGTATFSDTANEISEKRGYWLGDAFASGGSNGYDHKVVGITARGAWECVKLHFRELGRDIQSEPFTVVGIGDMSGDVFGNGMLLSRMIRLQAAFNHQHIFLDPNPEPESTWHERERIFRLPRSTWKDYTPELISAGGGVFDRKAKAIPLSPQAQTLLGVDADSLTGDEIIRAILRMEVDLLWFGGIGTYVKSPLQSSLHVGDQANDNVRIDSTELQAKVIGEGANLGFTQLGRIDYSNRGGLLNTDAIDNSAGVNMSDYEVNLKILLQKLRRSGKLDSDEERNALLHEATEEVAELVLANNRGQHWLLSMDRIRSRRRFQRFRAFISWLEERGMNSRSEYIPTPKDLDQLEQAGLPMPRPVLAVMQSYVKMTVFDALSNPELPFDPALDPIYLGYVPPRIRERFGNAVLNHPLKREIIAMIVTNSIINYAGCGFFPRLAASTGRALPDLAQAYLILDQSLRGPSLRRRLLMMPSVTEQEKYEVLIEMEESLLRAVQGLLQSGAKLKFKLVEVFQPLFTEMLDIGTPVEQMDLNAFASLILRLRSANDVLHLQQRHGLDVAMACTAAGILEAEFGLEQLWEQLDGLSAANEWELRHQELLLQSLDLRKRQLLDRMVAGHTPESLRDLAPEAWVEPLRTAHPTALQAYQQTQEQIRTSGLVNLTVVSVALSHLELGDPTL
jgi:glutamate dehydrogenase